MPNTVSISKDEYTRLKRVDKLFGKFANYAQHLAEISSAREEVKSGKVISQDKLFRQLGL